MKIKYNKTSPYSSKNRFGVAAELMNKVKGSSRTVFCGGQEVEKQEEEQ